MNKLLKLTRVDNREIMVNFANIIYIESIKDVTWITLVGGDEIKVLESMEHIYNIYKLY